jgi:hypothetical protein
MGLFSSSPLAQRLAIGATVLATAGVGVSLLTKPTSPPEFNTPTVSAPAASDLPASAPASTVSQASVPAASAPAANAPAAPLEVTALAQKAPGKATRRFPFVTGANAPVATRINNQLFIDTFQVLAPARASDGLSEVSTQTWQNQPEIDFKVLRNDGRIFSVAVQAESCGAYCESRTLSYAFDVASGRHLGSEDIFTAAGRKALDKKLKAANLAAIQAEISRLKNEQTKAGSSKSEAAQERTEALDMYKACAEQRQSPDADSALAPGALQIQAKAVVVSMERCSNHALRALDKVGNFSLRLSPDQLAPWLSDYGRYLLLGDAARFAAPVSPWGQVLRGKLDGKLPVTLALGTLDPNGSLEGHYFYDRYRKPIALSGRFEEGTLTLTEAESKETPPPRLVLTADGMALRGRWEGGASKLDATLEP